MEELMLKEFVHVIDALFLYISLDRATGSPDCGHGLGPTAVQPFIGKLYADMAVIDRFAVLLNEVNEVVQEEYLGS